MASTINQSTGQRYTRIPAWLRELDFVTDGFTWLFRLMSRGAEPLMTLSTVYVIIEAGVPAVSVTWLHFLAVAIMISAPEIILPGGFILAGEIRAQGNRRAWMLYSMCWLFVILTSATLADLFIWHFTGGAFAALMWSRCAAAVGYSILFRVITYRREREVLPVADVQANITEHFTEHIQRLESLTRQHMTEIEQSVTRQMQSLTEQVDRALTENTNKNDTTALPAMIEQLSQETQRQITTLAQEVKRSLETVQARPKLSLVAAPPSTSPRTTEQEFDKGAFVRLCLTEHPDIRNAEIIRLASEQGQNISSGYVSDIRKAFEERTA